MRPLTQTKSGFFLVMNTQCRVYNHSAVFALEPVDWSACWQLMIDLIAFLIPYNKPLFSLFLILNSLNQTNNHSSYFLAFPQVQRPLHK